MTATASRSGDIDRALYQFRILAETAAELSGARHPHKILESFLLSAQGGLGARGGFAAILDGPAFRLMAQSGMTRALVPEYAIVLRSHLDSLEGQGPAPFFVPALQGELCPGQCELLLVCPLDEGQEGVLGLESNLAGRSFDEHDRALVASLGTLFQTSLRFSLFAARIELLNAELLKRNDALDRQIYHLSALRDLSREIVRVDMTEVMDALLLTVLGHFARPQGLLLLYERGADTVLTSSKGLTGNVDLAPRAVERLLFLALTGVREKRLVPLQVGPVEHLEALAELPLGLCVGQAYLFMLRENFYGILLLAEVLDPAATDDELLLAFVSQGVMHLKNADSFATITGLNEDLRRQNRELRETIAELTRARDRISMLEAAGRRIAAVVQRKVESLMRVRAVDFMLILVLSLGVALAFNTQNPRGIPLVEPAGPEVPGLGAREALAMLESEEALLIDARPREFFERGHPDGAVNVPAQLFDLVYMMQLSAEDPARPILVSGRSISRRHDLIVARKLLGRDHEQVFVVLEPLPLDRKGEPR